MKRLFEIVSAHLATVLGPLSEAAPAISKVPNFYGIPRAKAKRRRGGVYVTRGRTRTAKPTNGYSTLMPVQDKSQAEKDIVLAAKQAKRVQRFFTSKNFRKGSVPAHIKKKANFIALVDAKISKMKKG